jgi:hypothetical protein
MKISFLEDYGEFKAGQEVDLPANEAQRIINTGYAFSVMGQVEKKGRGNPAPTRKPVAKKGQGNPAPTN